DVVAALGGGRPLPAHPVVLTFDDGYRDFSTTALPVLEADGLTATVFVVSGFVGRPGYMTAADVAAAAAAGMTIGAHTVHHVALRVLGPLGLRATPGPDLLPAPGRMAERIPGTPY